MKKNISILLLMTGIIAFTACSRDEESLFDTPAALRVTQTLENAEQVLTHAEYGWEFLYFPNPASAGNNIFVSFKDNGNVSATGHNVLAKGSPIVTDETSTWELMSDYGPILTFNTYNKILHAWADPQTDGDGYLGDYEFLILKTTNDQVLLKGKKHSGYSVMNRLTEATDYKAYAKEVEQTKKNLFNNGNIFSFVKDGQTYMLYNGNSGAFTLQKLGEAIATTGADIYPFAGTRTGIYMMSGFPGNTEDRAFNVDGNVLRSSNLVLSNGNLVNYFDAYSRIQGKSWLIDASQCSDDVAAIVTTINTKLQQMAGTKKAKLVGSTIYYTYSTSIHVPSQYYLALRYTLDGKSNTDVEFVANITVNGAESVSIEYKGAESDNAKNLLKNLPELAQWLNKLTGTYTLSAEGINPSMGMKFTSKSDANTWLTLTGF